MLAVACASVQRCGVQTLGEIIEQELLQRPGAGDLMTEGVGALAADHCVRVISFGQKQEACLATVGHAWQRGLQRAECRLASGLVAIKTEHHLRAQAENALEVSVAGGGAEGGRGVADAALGQGDHVHVALHHQQAVEFAVGLACFVQAVELAALVEDGGFRRVQVLRLVIAEYAAAEGNNASALVADGKDNAIAKAVVKSVGVVSDQHARVQQLSSRLLALAHGLEQVVPARRSKAQTKAAGDFAGQAAPLQVVDCPAGLCVCAQGVLVKASGLLQQGIQGPVL